MKKRKPVIGITARYLVKNNKSIIQLNEDYRLAIINSGGIPLIILPTDNINYGKSPIKKVKRLTEEEKKDLKIILSKCDGILMPGGYKWYEFDEIVCRYALDNNIPILGICLGMQILGSINNFGNDEGSDRTIKNSTSINHCQKNKKYVHNCIIVKGFLYDILKVNNIMVNSRHNYHINKTNYFEIDAYSEDGIIEAIHIPNHKFALGVQWHPESIINNDLNMKKIFIKFIAACEK